MTHIDQTRNVRSVSDVLREMVRALGVKGLLRQFAEEHDGDREAEGSLSIETKRDIGASTEVRDYATCEPLVRGSLRHLYGVADAAPLWQHRR